MKQTTDLAKGLCDSIGRTNSLAHYKEKGKFDEATFESVDFEPVKMVLTSKPKIYILGYGKQQYSGFYGTGKWLEIRSKEKKDYRCPSCYRLQKDTAHLMVCPCNNRTKLLHESIEVLAEGMKLHKTKPALTKVECIYLRGWEGRCFRVPGITFSLWDIAITQNRICWRHFMKRKK